MVDELFEGPEAFSWIQNVLYIGLRGHLCRVFEFKQMLNCKRKIGSLNNLGLDPDPNSAKCLDPDPDSLKPDLEH
jgi:hypothetical protein